MHDKVIEISSVFEDVALLRKFISNNESNGNNKRAINQYSSISLSREFSSVGMTNVKNHNDNNN